MAHPNQDTLLNDLDSAFKHITNLVSKAICNVLTGLITRKLEKRVKEE
jgi:ribosomal protein S17E